MMLEHESEIPTEIKQLSPCNPLDHLRLLWWALAAPQRMTTCQEVYDEKDRRKVGGWLDRTFGLLPSLLLALAWMLGRLPTTETTHTPITYLLVGIGLILVWMLIGWLERREIGCLTIIASVALSIGVMFVMPLVIDEAALGKVGIVAFGVALSVVSGVELGMESDKSISFMSLIGTFLSTSRFVGIVLFSLSFLVRLGVMWVVKRNLRTGSPSWLGWGVSGILMLAYAVLIWISFLGGWRVFV
ncbi:MAG: hypothetical protein GY845_15365 [Planctomycetes bacterium]|nr:hypothetical protein [Planctomycetota bacterium]